MEFYRCQEAQPFGTARLTPKTSLPGPRLAPSEPALGAPSRFRSGARSLRTAFAAQTVQVRIDQVRHRVFPVFLFFFLSTIYASLRCEKFRQTSIMSAEAHSAPATDATAAAPSKAPEAPIHEQDGLDEKLFSGCAVGNCAHLKLESNSEHIALPLNIRIISCLHWHWPVLVSCFLPCVPASALRTAFDERPKTWHDYLCARWGYAERQEMCVVRAD